MHMRESILCATHGFAYLSGNLTLANMFEGKEAPTSRTSLYVSR